jgi:predicted DNA-binding transcriptional regulator AlpA
MNDPTKSEDKFGIKAAWTYRKSHRDTQHILGMGLSAIDKAIRDGTLPPPAPLTKHGKAKGWGGWQLIQVVEERLKAAQQRAAAKAQTIENKKAAKKKALRA